MTEAPSKREQMKEERRKQILGAALAVFTEKGFHAANVSEVAARAGVSQGTIYWYFDSKEDLFEAALLSVFDDFGQGAIETMMQQPTASEKLFTLARVMEDFGEEMEGLLMMFLGYWAASPEREKTGEWWIDLLDQYKEWIVAIIEEGVRNSEFKAVDAESLAWAVMAAYDGLAAYAMFLPELDLKQVSQAFMTTLLEGLKA